MGHDDYDHDNSDLHDPPEQGSATNPLLLNSEEEDLNDISLSQPYSFYEVPSEDEQYLWAMEESLRASQEFACDGDADEAKVKNDPDHSKHSPQVFGAGNPFTDKEFTKNVHDHPEEPDEARVSKRTKLSSDNEPNITTRDENKDDFEGKKSVEDDEDEDEDLKVAIIASLETTDTTALREMELQEQENKEFEEAIKRSLLDLEENKENISPEQPESKKGKKGKKSAKLTRSCSQSLTLTLDRPKSLPPTLRRAISVNDTESLRSGRCRSQSSSQYSSQEESANFFSYTRPSRPSGEELWSSTHMPAEEPTTANESRGKGKGKAPKRTQVETKDQSLGLFQLQAAVSHTGVTSSTLDGHYVCDYLGADGDWRYHDGDKRMKTGPISELNKSRGRTGYLFFYVRRRPEDKAH
ncbi:hypothetical protein BGZ58_007834 [Dissophora ornata]|nr:hypothetical protein BGZ58_007834 [Dissophora ornata]